MKTFLLFFTLIFNPMVYAQGSFIGGPPPSVAKAKTTTSVPVPVPAPPASIAKVTAPATPPTEVCSSNFAKAAELVKAVHGKDADLSRLGSFPGQFHGYNSENSLKKNGENMFLNLTIMGGLVMDVDLPVTVCRIGNKLTAEILTSKAVSPGTNVPHERVAGMVKDKPALRAITLNITRQQNSLIFYGQAASTVVQAAAGLK